ncbi:MAG TPA: TetR/AcrR family transcriptional regulator [Verrucomicrobiae bacterium]|nr:TetR/AcrR family transcriptional regulator [Verrucomicrobiae bacterium]
MTAKTPDAQFKDLAAAQIEDLSPRERILKTASDLFYKHGINSTGIDRIIAESGVAKMTFYRHFPSKCCLVAEYLAHRDQAWQRLLDESAGDTSKPPLERLLAIFNALERSIKNPGFYGCPFIKTLAEFGPERNEPQVQERLDSHFEGMEAVVGRLLKEIRPKDSKNLVAPVMSLICGTIVVAQATGRTDIATKNREVVKALLRD